MLGVATDLGTIGTTTNGVVLAWVDARGAPIRPATVWLDARAGDQVSDQWVDSEFVAVRSGLKVTKVEGAHHRGERQPARSPGS